jgi:hypothetical protein
MSRLIAFLPRFSAGIALAVAFVLAPSVLPSGGGTAEARTEKQCVDRPIGCVARCSKSAVDKHGTGTKKTDDASDACEKRTCNHQRKSCLANASDTKKPTKAVAEPSGAGPKTKVQPKGQPGKVSEPGKAPITRVPPKVHPMGIQGSGGPTFRKNR